MLGNGAIESSVPFLWRLKKVVTARARRTPRGNRHSYSYLLSATQGFKSQSTKGHYHCAGHPESLSFVSSAHDKFHLPFNPTFKTGTQ